MQTKPTAAAPLEMKGAAAANFGPNYSPAEFIKTIKTARATLETYGGDIRNSGPAFWDCVTPACEAEFPGVGNPITYTINKYGRGTMPLGGNIMYISWKLFCEGQTNGVLDYMKFWGKVLAIRKAVSARQATKEDIERGEFWYDETQLNILVRGASIYHRSEIPGIAAETFVRRSEAFFCPLSRQYWHENNFRKLKTFTRLPASPAVSPFVSSSGVLTYDIYERACSLYPCTLVYVDYYRALIPEDEFHLFDIVVNEDNGQYYHTSELHQHSDGLYYSRPEGFVCTPSDAVASYHSGTRAPAPVRFSRNNSILTGWEVEKEDLQVKCSITHRDFERALPSFRKERDGSLDADSGFEFITPPMELSPRSIKAFFEARPVALSHINAKFSAKCGGHVHISKPGYDGPALFNEIAGYLPLFYALFPRRADGPDSHYCRAKTAADLLIDREKYQAINILSNRIEIRIFGAVKGLENLVWRAGLLKKIFAKPCGAGETRAFFYHYLPGLITHLSKVYTTPAEMERFMNRVAKYCTKYAGVIINPVRDFERGLITETAFLKCKPETGRAHIRAMKKALASS